MNRRDFNSILAVDLADDSDRLNPKLKEIDIVGSQIFQHVRTGKV
jgi:hypothetical protein